MRDASMVGHEVVGGILGRHAALNGKAGRGDGLLRSQADFGIGKGKPLGDEDLRLHDVDSRHLFGDGVLDLNPRIDLDEIELARVGIDQEFDRSRVLVTEFPADGERRRAQLVAKFRLEGGSRRDFDDLLMASLDRAVSLIEMDEVAVQVAQKLNLDMAGPRDVLFEKNVRGAESDL